MSNYPDWVNAYKEKGTSIKKVGANYYLYRSTSKRVPGKKYPQPIQEYIGTITKEGVVRTQVRKISTDRVRVFEFGLSYALESLLPTSFFINTHDKETMRFTFLHIVKYISPKSYLLRGIDLPTLEELQIDLNAQINRYEQLTGIKIEDLQPLSDLYLVEVAKCDMLSEITLKMREIFTSLRINTDAI
jgi:hypothetical protein